MLSDELSSEEETESEHENILASEPRILLFMEPGRDRDLLERELGQRYQIETTTELEALDGAFDCCIFDDDQFQRVSGTVQERRDTSRAVFLPFVLLVSASAEKGDVTAAWEYVDDIVELPVEKAALRSRIGNLVQRRRTAAKLAERETQLEHAVDDLRLKERAMDEAPVGITIAEPGPDENPILYANEQFTELTGYGSEQIGEDCRLLQGEKTDTETVSAIREAIRAKEPVSVDILNYKKSGQKFWNQLKIAPVHDEDGNVMNFVGFQSEITERKIRERRLEVLNRVLSHNLRNTMNLVQGYTTMLSSAHFDGEASEEVRKINDATAELMGLAEKVQDIEYTLSAAASTNEPLDFSERMKELQTTFEEQHPDARLEVTLPDPQPTVAVGGLMTAIEEAVENAIVHNDQSEPEVRITIEKRETNWIDIDIADNGPGIPEREVQVLDQGETPLAHADRLGIWLLYWVVSKAGGELSIIKADAEGTVLRLSVPTAESHDGRERSDTDET